MADAEQESHVKKRKCDLLAEGLPVVERELLVKVNVTGAGFLAISCEDDGLAYAGILLQANSGSVLVLSRRDSSRGLPGHINPSQLCSWRRVLHDEGKEELTLDGTTSSSADRTTISVHNRRMRSVRIRPQIASRTLCAKCRTPVIAQHQMATSKPRKLLSDEMSTCNRLLPSGGRRANGETGLARPPPTRPPIPRPPVLARSIESAISNARSATLAGNVAARGLDDARPPVPKPPVRLTPIVETRTANGYRFSPLCPRAAPTSSTISVRPVQSENPNEIPKLRIMMPGGRTSQQLPISSPPATGTALVKTGKPIDANYCQVGSSPLPAGIPPQPTIAPSPSHPPVRIRIGGVNYRNVPATTTRLGESFPARSLTSTRVEAMGQGVPTRKAVNGAAPALPRQANSPMTPVASIVEARRVALPDRRVIDLDREDLAPRAASVSADSPRAPNGCLPQVERTAHPVSVEPSPSENPFSLRVGDVVWAKMRGEPFWPASLFCFNPNAECCVLWMGSSLHGFLPISALEPFSASFVKRYNAKRNDRGYQKAVTDAIARQREKGVKDGYFETKLSTVAWKLLTGKKKKGLGVAGKRAKTVRMKQRLRRKAERVVRVADGEHAARRDEDEETRDVGAEPDHSARDVSDAPSSPDSGNGGATDESEFPVCDSRDSLPSRLAFPTRMREKAGE